jgi:type IV pilus assembly protein PilQ
MRTKRVGALTAIALVLSGTISWADAAPNHVRDVKVQAAPGGTEIAVVGTAAPTFSVRVSDAGRKLLIDLADADVAGAPEAITKPQGVVGGVLTQGFKTEAGTTTRLTVSLAHQATYSVRSDGETLRVLLAPAEKTAVAGANEPPAPAPAPAATKSAPAEAAVASVSDVKFERKGDKDRVVVALSAIPSYAMTPGPNGRIRLELRGARLASDGLARELDVSAMNGPLKSVSTFDAGGGRGTIVEIDRTTDAQGAVAVEGKSLVWSFDRATPRAVTSSLAKPMGGDGKSVTVERDDAPNVPRIETSIREPQVETASAGQAGFASSLRAQEGGGKYTGRRIDLDFQNADIHSILRMLADVGKVNVVTADDVSGAVTIRMRNVPWDQALDVILSAKGLGMVRQGNLIRVAPIATLQKEQEIRLAAMKARFEVEPTEMRLYQVSYAGAGELAARAKDLLSPRGSISVDERTNTLIMRDVAGNLNAVENLVRSLDTQTPQVLVEARIVEATSRYLRDVGIQWGGDTTMSAETGNPTGIAFPSKITTAGGAYDGNTPTAGISPFTRTVPTPNFAVNLPAAVGTGTGGALGLSFGSIDNNFNLNLRLSAAETSGLVRIVSSPRILTLNNREARINQGTLIPFAQISAQGVQTTFQEAKLQLLVKPHVTADGGVSMHVKVNRDEPDFNQTSPRGDPTILKREAETDLLVMDGHTAVIGGIFTRNTGRNLDQVPFFGDIPIIGVLFQRRRANDSRNELVIFLTPRIVNRDVAIGH